VRFPVATVADPRLAPYAALGDPARLAREGRFVAEGRLVLQRLVAAGGYDIDSVVVSPAAAAQLAEALDRLDPTVPVYVAPTALLEQLTGFNVHRGSLALVRRPVMRPLEEVLPRRTLPALLVVLERVANPDNVGGVFRNALAFGASGVLVDPATADPLYRKAIRTSMAATLTVPWSRCADWPGDLARLAAAGIDVVALVTERDAPPLGGAGVLPPPADLGGRAAASAGDAATGPPASGSNPVANRLANPASRIALLVGHEGDGLSAPALAHATRRVRIPMAPGADSLNAATATGIALHYFAHACGTISSA
jgi:tRNA G18 (ribose-2'-O)-methylase SpoU